MNTTSLDARTVMQPGGLYEGANNALLQGLMAYFQHKDRERQASRDMKRDEFQFGRQQLSDALGHAERYGVTPAADQSGWIAPDKAPLIEAAVARFKNAQREKMMADIAAGKALPDVDREAWMRNFHERAAFQNQGQLPDQEGLNQMLEYDPEYRQLEAQWQARESYEGQQAAAQQKAQAAALAAESAQRDKLADNSRQSLTQALDSLYKLQTTEKAPVYAPGASQPRLNAQGQMVNDLGQVVADPSQAVWDGTPMTNPTTGAPTYQEQPLTYARIKAMLDPLLADQQGLLPDDQARLRAAAESFARQGRGAPVAGQQGGAAAATGAATGQPAPPQGAKSQGEAKWATMAEINAKTEQLMNQDKNLAGLGFEKAREQIIARLRASGYTLRP